MIVVIVVDCDDEMLVNELVVATFWMSAVVVELRTTWMNPVSAPVATTS